MLQHKFRRLLEGSWWPYLPNIDPFHLSSLSILSCRCLLMQPIVSALTTFLSSLFQSFTTVNEPIFAYIQFLPKFFKLVPSAMIHLINVSFVNSFYPFENLSHIPALPLLSRECTDENALTSNCRLIFCLRIILVIRSSLNYLQTSPQKGDQNWATKSRCGLTSAKYNLRMTLYLALVNSPDNASQFRSPKQSFFLACTHCHILPRPSY